MKNICRKNRVVRRCWLTSDCEYLHLSLSFLLIPLTHLHHVAVWPRFKANGTTTFPLRCELGMQSLPRSTQLPARSPKSATFATKG
jgi:hypothetical protein